MFFGWIYFCLRWKITLLRFPHWSLHLPHLQKTLQQEQHSLWHNLICLRDIFYGGSSTSTLNCLQNLFSPDLEYLQEFDKYKINNLSLDHSLQVVVHQNSSAIREDILRSLILWGLQPDFTWFDCLDEAQTVADSDLMQRAIALLQYIEVRSAHIDVATKKLSNIQSPTTQLMWRLLLLLLRKK